DVACGGGGTTLAIARQCKPGSVVHGFDLSPELLEAARAKTPTYDVVFERVDVAIAPPPTRRYDRLVSRFGVMFFEDPPAAFEAPRHWLLPGGRFAFAVWGAPAENPWAMMARDVVAEIVDPPALDHSMPGPFRYADADALVARLAQAGFTDVRARGWRAPFAMGGVLAPDAAASFALKAFSRFAQLLRQGGGSITSARQMLAARFAPHVTDGVVRLNAHVHIVTGTRD
ncbi:MAG: SAM-dependent methyltransferase, partial [Bradymonadia bacterium]